MSITRKNFRRLAALAAVGLGLWAPDGLAFPNFGPQINGICQAFNGTSPDDGSCTLCHVSNRGTRVEPAWTWWLQGPRENFCPPAANRAPNGTIVQPPGPVAITAGQSVFFQASGTDPDGDALTFAWDFGGGAPASTQQQPGDVAFAAPGTYTVRLTVTDSGGLADPTPPTRSVTVLPVAPVCTDGDGDGFAVQGGACGPVDCNDGDAAVNPGATESCTDGVDNDCDGLVDAADPGAVSCPVRSGCVDFDGDGFSPEGGICGPLDCNDGDAAVNPGARELCGDGRDNDCDGATDAADAECNGTDCVGDLIDAIANEPPVCVIDAPAGNLTVAAGQSVAFAGTASDPNGDPLALRWTFGGARADATTEDPGSVTFAQAGTFEVRFTATDDRGLACAPAARTITVQPAPTQTIDITRARWDRGDRELDVRGRWTTTGATARLFNADTGALLATTRTERDDGRIGFEFELERIAVVPCRVRVEIDGQVGERAVDDAPAGCDGGAPTPNTAPLCRIDAPAGDVTIVAGQSVRFAGTGTDPDGDLPLAFAWRFGGGAADAGVEDPGDVRFDAQGTFAVTFTVTDARGLACPTPARRTVVVQPRANLDPIAADDAAATDEDTPVTIAVLANDSDPDGDGLALASVTQPASGSTARDGSGVRYTPAPDFAGTDRFRYTVSDGRGGEDSAEVTVTVRPVNDPPVARDDAVTIDAGRAASIPVLANDTDVDGDMLIVSQVSQPANGSASGAGNSVSYVPRLGFRGTDSFTYEVSDSRGGTDTATVTVTVREADGEEPDDEAGQGGRVEIDEARWSRRSNELRVEGEGSASGATGTVRAASSGALLGTTRAESDGDWRLRLGSPEIVPCRVRVEIGTLAAERGVRGAPRDCR